MSALSSFRIEPVSVEVGNGQHAITVVPPSQWLGQRQEQPTRAVLANVRADDGLRATRAGDTVHPDTMETLRSQGTGDFADKVRASTAVKPRGPVLWIDNDGAVGGFIGATPRLLGHLSPDPEGASARGFFTPHFYAVEGNEIADPDSGEGRKPAFAEVLPDGTTTLRVTTYGDVVPVEDVDGLARVATVTHDEWFSGHLG